jgi:hypothetical protein
MEIPVALAVGLAAGAHTATWGMFKDAPYEGFTWLKYSRSIVLSGAIAIVLVSVADFASGAASMVVLFGLTYVIERAMTEFYKTFLREEDQSKYFIPMQVAIRGRVVTRRWQRWLLGAGYAVAVALIVVAISALDDAGVDGLPAVLVVGSLGGWISAFGGAWKDAPLEGFHLLKFFRSPLVAMTYALLLAALTTNFVYFSMGALGYTVATLETYKTFFKPNVPRGKFAGKEIRFPEMLTNRFRFVPLYVGIWIAVVVGFVVAFAQPHHGVI